MKILFITKRFSTSRDALDDKVFRQWNLPMNLARIGNDVDVFCLSYRRKPVGTYDFSEQGYRHVWHSRNLTLFPPLGLVRFIANVVHYAKEYKPDVVISGSDSFYGAIGLMAARACNAKAVFDLYDNFESFGNFKIPGVATAYRYALKHSDGLVCISAALKEHILSQYATKQNICVIGNGTDTDTFYPRDKQVCRTSLGLPATGRLIGTAGALSRSRGIDALFDAFLRLAREQADVYLVLAGPIGKGVILPDHERVIYLGILDNDRVPEMLNSLDLGVICNTANAFGTYCHPLKLGELVACKIPVVVADTPGVQPELDGQEQLAYRPGDADSLYHALRANLEHPIHINYPARSWGDIGMDYQQFLTTLT